MARIDALIHGRRLVVWLSLSLLWAQACSTSHDLEVEIALARSAQDVAGRLDPDALDSAWMPEAWELSGWLKKSEVEGYRDWILICPLRAGEPIAVDCLRRPARDSGRAEVLAVEGAERIWPGQAVRLLSCEGGAEPRCRDLGSAKVLGRLPKRDPSGRLRLALDLDARQRALLGPRLFVASLAEGSGEQGPRSKASTVRDLLDAKNLLSLHAERMERMQESLRAWGRARSSSEGLAP